MIKKPRFTNSSINQYGSWLSVIGSRDPNFRVFNLFTTLTPDGKRVSFHYEIRQRLDILIFPLEDGSVVLNQCLNSCHLFAEKKCPQQQLLERLYLFPQLSAIEEIEKICRSACCTKEALCSENAERVLAHLRQLQT